MVVLLWLRLMTAVESLILLVEIMFLAVGRIEEVGAELRSGRLRG